MTKRYIHAVHSSKGGSGKSSFSFALAKYFNTNKKKGALLIDADFRGTSMESIFKKEIIKADSLIVLKNDNNSDQKYFNDIIFNEVYDIDDCKRQITIKEYSNVGIKEEKREIEIDTCFSSPKQSHKDAFLYSANDRGPEKISVERFKDAFDSFLDNLNGFYPNQYDHLIFDLSPSTDEYTESMLDTFLYKAQSNDTIFYHYILVTDDMAHIESSAEYICKLTTGKLRLDNSKRKIVVVINQNYSDELLEMLYPGASDESTKNLLEEVEKKIKDLLHKMNVADEAISDLIFLSFPFCKEMFIYCRDDYTKSKGTNILLSIRPCENKDENKDLKEILGIEGDINGK